MLLETLTRPWQKARSVNQTSNGYVSKVPTATEPLGDAGTATGAAVIDLNAPVLGGPVQNSLLACFYGAGSNANTFSARLIGWRVLGSDPTVLIWVPVLLCEVTATLSSTAPGADSLLVSSSELFADTLTLVTGNAGVSSEVVSPTGGIIAHLLADVKGFRKLEFSFTTGGSATNCNAIYTLL